MNTYVTLACLLAVLGVCHSNPVGYGLGYGYGSYYAPAVSTANVYKAAPISVIRTAAVAPIIAPAVSTVPVLKTVNYGEWQGYGSHGYGGLGYGGHGYGGLGYGYGGWGGLGYGGWGGLGYGGWGGKGWGGWGQH